MLDQTSSGISIHLLTVRMKFKYMRNFSTRTQNSVKYETQGHVISRVLITTTVPNKLFQCYARISASLITGLCCTILIVVLYCFQLQKQFFGSTTALHNVPHTACPHQNQEFQNSFF